MSNSCPLLIHIVRIPIRVYILCSSLPCPWSCSVKKVAQCDGSPLAPCRMGRGSMFPPPAACGMGGAGDDGTTGDGRREHIQYIYICILINVYMCVCVCYIMETQPQFCFELLGRMAIGNIPLCRRFTTGSMSFCRIYRDHLKS